MHSTQNEQVGVEAWETHKQIALNESVRRQLLLDNAKLIHNMHANGLYKAILGDENAPWSAYLTQHDVFYSASKVYTLDKVYQTFVVKLSISVERISAIPLTKLQNLVPVVNKINVEEWLTKAETLTAQDFTDELRIAQGKESYQTCSHKNELDYKICQSCGFRHKV